MNACIAFGGLDVIKINLGNGKVKISKIFIFKPCHARKGSFDEGTQYNFH
jgi:hypothetical protein